MTCHYARLDAEALLHITGPDALSFLQGQLTCDTRKLTPDTALPGLYCTAAGRVVCDFLLCQIAPDHFVMRLRRDIRDASAATLARYIIFSKATLEAGADERQVLSCWGSGAARVLREVFDAAPIDAQYGACSGDGYTLVQMDRERQQFECYLDPLNRPELLARLTSAAQNAGAERWQLLQIGAGIGRIEAATTGEFIPQMLNYDLTGHISFNKGCYTGQEVVARLHYRGKSKRRMYLAEPADSGNGAGAAPVAGTALYTGAARQSVGTVVNSVATEAGQWLALVTATSGAVAAGLRIGAADGPAVNARNLPYYTETA